VPISCIDCAVRIWIDGGYVMKENQSDVHVFPIRDYDDNVTPADIASVPGVIVPPDPPVFGPLAARAFLRLIAEVRHKRVEKSHHSPSEEV
jgi:hypothetical protein